jgi:hypothetical protein
MKYHYHKTVRLSAIALLGIALTIGSGCKKSFLEGSPVGEELQSTYYSTPSRLWPD